MACAGSNKLGALQKFRVTALTACDQDLAVGQQDCGLKRADGGHRAHRRKRRRLRIENFGAVGRRARVRTTCHKHVAGKRPGNNARRKPGGAVILARRAHPAGRRELSGRRIVEFSGSDVAAALIAGAARDQHVSRQRTAGNQRGRMTRARRLHRAGRGELAGGRVVQLRTSESSSERAGRRHSSCDQYFSVGRAIASGNQCRGMLGARGVHLRSDRGKFSADQDRTIQPTITRGPRRPRRPRSKFCRLATLLPYDPLAHLSSMMRLRTRSSTDRKALRWRARIVHCPARPPAVRNRDAAPRQDVPPAVGRHHRGLISREH